MKISLEWLGELMDGSVEAQQAADALTMGGFPVESIEQVGPDTVLDVEVTSNRGDCLSCIGVARELAALINRELKPRALPAISSSGNAAIKVRIDAPELCFHYTARIIRGVKVQPSPEWLQRRIKAVGLRPINNIVDITNYVLFEMGQPLHAFDLNKLTGDTIIVRNAKQGETLTSIDGHQRALRPDMLVIADNAKPVALAGVMGGLDSEVSEQTTDILLESARFEPLCVRTTARALAMASDSSYRFERGIDPTLPARASDRAIELILQTAGGTVEGPRVEAGTVTATGKGLSLRLARLNRMVGYDVSPTDAVAALERLGFAPKLGKEAIDVTVPTWRLDVNIEVDLIEEVSRVLGYEHIPVEPEIRIRLAPVEPGAVSTEMVAGVLVGAGYFEAVTFSWVSDALANEFRPPEAVQLLRAESTVRKADANLRPSLIPALLEAVRRNEMAANPGARLFEIGSTFWVNAQGAVDERRRLGLAGSGDVREVRGTIEAVLTKLDAHRAIRVVPDARSGFNAGACGRIEWGNETIGWFGQVSDAVVQKLGLREAPVAAEIEIAPLIAGAQHVPQLQALPKYPAIRRDLSLVVPDATRYEQIESLVVGQKPKSLERVEYVTTYKGKPLEKSAKSVTITLVFRSPTGTLTSEEVESAVGGVIDAAKRDLGATLRE